MGSHMGCQSAARGAGTLSPRPSASKGARLCGVALDAGALAEQRGRLALLAVEARLGDGHRLPGAFVAPP